MDVRDKIYADDEIMEDARKENDLKEQKSDESLLKEKYGKLYKITTELIEDDEDVKEAEYIFKKPQAASYDRYIKTAGKSATKSLRTFLLDNVIAEHEEKLKEDLEEYPALTLSVGQKLLNLMGLSDNVNLLKL